MNNKQVPPSVAQFVVRERAELLARIAELEARIVWLECEAQVNAGMKAAKARADKPSYASQMAKRWGSIMPEAQGVVMPERLKPSRYELHDAAVDAWNSCLDEVARLNSAPVQQVSVPDGWRSMVDRLASTVENLNEVARGQITDDMEDPDYEHGLCDKHDDIVREARAMLIAAPAAPAEDAGIVDMYRHLQKVTPYRFKKIQDASITDGGDVMYFHKDRFDAAVLADMAAPAAPAADASHVFYGMDGNHP